MSAPVELETLPPSQSQSEQPSTAPSIAPSQDEEQQQLRPPTVPNSGRPACFRSLAHEVIFVFVVSSAQMMTQANLGNTIVPIKQVSAGLGLKNDVNESWFVASYACTVGAFVLITGRMGDIYGKKLIFVLGWVWLSLFNLATGFAPNEIVYDVFRALAGIGPSALMPNASALFGTAYQPGPRKNMVFAVFGAVAPRTILCGEELMNAAGFVIGAVWGGLFGQFDVQWRWIYWSMAIVSMIYALSTVIVVPNELNLPTGGSFDYIGSFLGVSGLILIFFSLNSGPTLGWDRPYTYILLIVGLLALVLFVLVERKVAHPVLPIETFATATFGAVCGCVALGWMSFGMFTFYLPQFLIQFRHISELEVGLQFFPVIVTGPIACVIAVYLLPRVPTYIIFGASMVSFCVGQILMALTPPEQTYWAMTFPTTAIVTFGPDLAFASASLIASDAVPHGLQGVAGSFINTIVNYSIAIGLALAGAVQSGVNSDGSDPLKGYRGAWWLGTGFAGLGILITAIFYKGMSKKHKHE